MQIVYRGGGIRIRRDAGAVLLGLACLIALGAKANAASGPVLWLNDNNNQLGTLDLGTPSTNVIGSLGSGTLMSDIAFDSNGNLYGINTDDDFYSINPTTGKTTLISHMGGNILFNALVGGANDTLYAAGYASKDLYAINPTTGAYSDIGVIGWATAGDLAFVDGALYASVIDPKSSYNDLARISLDGGKVSANLVGSFGVPNMFGLASDGNGILYAAANTEIYTVDPQTADLTPLLYYGQKGLTGASGLAFVDESAGAPATTTTPTTSVPLPRGVWPGALMLLVLVCVKTLGQLAAR